MAKQVKSNSQTIIHQRHIRLSLHSLLTSLSDLLSFTADKMICQISSYSYYPTTLKGYKKEEIMPPKGQVKKKAKTELLPNHDTNEHSSCGDYFLPEISQIATEDSEGGKLVAEMFISSSMYSANEAFLFQYLLLKSNPLARDFMELVLTRYAAFIGHQPQKEKEIPQNDFNATGRFVGGCILQFVQEDILRQHKIEPRATLVQQQKSTVNVNDLTSLCQQEGELSMKKLQERYTEFMNTCGKDAATHNLYQLKKLNAMPTQAATAKANKSISDVLASKFNNAFKKNLPSGVVAFSVICIPNSLYTN